MRIFFIFCISFFAFEAVAQRSPQIPIGTVLPTRQVPVHDPVMIKEGNTWYLFCTGRGISVWSSIDLKNWKKRAPVFATPRQWALDTIPGFNGHTWAPDISYHNGLYYLYYSVSAFGKNTSAIGVATNKTLDTASADFGWNDHGRVIQSYPGRTPWNAIDANLILDENQNPWLAFGSFWNGIMMVPLTNDFLKPAELKDSLIAIASRKRNPSDPNPIEAPFISRKGAWFYLFASIDYCCKGVNSTYKVVVGRSKNLQGPYKDKDGIELRNGGGTILLKGNQNWHGVGHNGIYSDGKIDYIIYHGYDAADGGKSKLLIQELTWDKQGWPSVSHATASNENE